MIRYKRYYHIFYSINGEPHIDKYNSYTAFISMCKQMSKTNKFDYVKPAIIIEWNSLQDLYSGILSGNTIPDGQQEKESIQIMETAKNNVKNSKQLTLNL